jgi:murein DD-endopeptidase MepM/ murein hydrolase activator NlpD
MTRRVSSSGRSRGTVYIIFLLVFLLSAGLVFFLFFEGEAPLAVIEEPTLFIGAESDITVTAKDGKSGLQSVSLTISQGGIAKELFTTVFPRRGYTGVIGRSVDQRKLVFKPKEAGFKDGAATITLTARDYSARNFLKGNVTSISHDITIDTTPPRINIIHNERYIYPGGSGIVIYRVSDPDTRHGIVVNGNYFPGFLVGDGRDDTNISYFALPYQEETISDSFVIAEDRAGNRAQVTFATIYKNKEFKKDRINVGDSFLDQKIPEFEQNHSEMQGNPVEKYLYVNNELRVQNNNQIRLLCNKPHPQRLWSNSFTRMPGSTRSGYADHRTYYYADKPIDKQVHLGIDIASTKHADVTASEKGIVVHADYLGIYGNMVLLDHGQGVFSLYSHLSQINVAPGDLMEKGDLLGLTGTTGMAGGDHLHFSMLVHGIFVTPVEWWDQHWIDVTIEEPLTDSRF